MVALQRIFVKAYWTLVGVGVAWAACVLLLIVPSVQRRALYAHQFQPSFRGNVSNPEEFGFARGQVQPFWLETADHERLFCWHVVPLDVYLENESELVLSAGEVASELRGTLGERLMRDEECRVVVSFHGNAGHIAHNHRPSLYRTISGIPKTHLLTCSYRGFGSSTLLNAPHLPTETGLITDAISLLSYIHSNLSHPSTRTVLLGHSLGTAVTTASALYFANSSSPHLPASLTPPSPNPLPQSKGYAGIILIAPFRSIPELLKTYKIGGIIPVLKPLRGYPRLADFMNSRILDIWPTQSRLLALLSSNTASQDQEQEHAQAPPLHQSTHLTLLHARNDQATTFNEAEALFLPLQHALLGDEGATSAEERRSIHGGDRVRRGAFAYRRVEDGTGKRSVELEILRFGGHEQGLGWSAVGLAVRRAFSRARTEAAA